MSDCAGEATYEPPPARELTLRPCVRFDAELRGAWLADADPERRVFLTQCPLIASQYACTTIGLPHGAHASRLRFAPSSCQLRPFCASALAGLLASSGGRRLIVQGDSHARQVYASLACKLWRAGVTERLLAVRGSIANATVCTPRLGCEGHSFDEQTRIMCGPAGCVGPSGAANAIRSQGAMQSGPLADVDLELVGGGRLLYRSSVEASEAERLVRGGHSDYYQRVFTALHSELHLRAEDVVLLSDIGGRHVRSPQTIRAIAASLVSAVRSGAGATPHVAWIDGMAPHFKKGPDGEFYSGVRSCVVAGTRRPVEADSSPAAAELSRGSHCAARGCVASGVINPVMLPALAAAGVPAVVSYYATREVHLAHSGVPFRNYSRWTQPDCSHVCSPSGPDELRTSLLYNALVSGVLFNATERRRAHALGSSPGPNPSTPTHATSRAHPHLLTHPHPLPRSGREANRGLPTSTLPPQCPKIEMPGTHGSKLRCKPGWNLHSGG